MATPISDPAAAWPLPAIAFKDSNQKTVFEGQRLVIASIGARLAALEGGKQPTAAVLASTGGAISSGAGGGGGFAGVLAISQGGTGLASLGAANRLLGVNAGGSALEYKVLQGTANQVSVAFAAGAVTLSGPQSLGASNSPTFSGLTLSSLSTAGVVTNTSLGVLGTSASPSLTGLTLAGLGASQPVVTNASLALASQSYSSFLSSLGISAATGSSRILQDAGAGIYSLTAIGSLLSAGSGISISGSTAAAISNTGVLSLAGTANQVSVSSSTGAITLSGPQNLGTSNSPAFSGLTLNGLSASQPVVTGAGKALASQSYSSFLTSLGVSSATGSGCILYDAGSADWAQASGVTAPAAGALQLAPASTTQNALQVALPASYKASALGATDSSGNVVAALGWSSVGTGILGVTALSGTSGSSNFSSMSIGGAPGSWASAGNSFANFVATDNGGKTCAYISFVAVNSHSGTGTPDRSTSMLFLTTPIGSITPQVNMQITSQGSVVISNGGANLAQGATDGFLYVPYYSTTNPASAPSGTPTSQAGSCPLQVVNLNGAYYIYIYVAGLWRRALIA